ncbi:MAG: transcriptional regulator, GntR family [Herbinix sp.]|jgi:GntR family transcriptional regulator|nr:transcriptional regulator, GntR family [Herbinix sp.]
MALYDQIIHDIYIKIQDKTLMPGDMLPTELELCKQYNVSRPTVRTAMIKLVNDGHLTRVKGKGTFVTSPKLMQESTQFIESYNEEMISKGLTPLTVVLELKTCPCPEHVYTKLNIPLGTKLIKLQRLRYARPNNEEKPVVLTTVYVPYELAPFLLDYDFEAFSLYNVLERNGIFISNVVRELEIKTLYGKTANLLMVKEGSPAHFISSVGYNSKGTAIEYSESYYPGNLNKFVIKISR